MKTLLFVVLLFFTISIKSFSQFINEIEGNSSDSLILKKFRDTRMRRGNYYIESYNNNTYIFNLLQLPQDTIENFNLLEYKNNKLFLHDNKLKVLAIYDLNEQKIVKTFSTSYLSEDTKFTLSISSDDKLFVLFNDNLNVAYLYTIENSDYVSSFLNTWEFFHISPDNRFVIFSNSTLRSYAGIRKAWTLIAFSICV